MSTASPRFQADLLVVDDAPANLQLLFGMLKERGYRVRPVPSGRLALQATKAEVGTAERLIAFMEKLAHPDGIASFDPTHGGAAA